MSLLDLTNASDAPTPRRPFTLRDTELADCRVQSPTARVFFGIGTSGSSVVDSVLTHAEQRLGRLPGFTEHLLIDAEANRPKPGRNEFVAGAHGAGTDPTKGRAIFDGCRRELGESLTTRLTRLMRVDPEFPVARPPRVLTEAYVVAGPGGTSGGFLQPLIDLLHEVARRVGIKRLYVHLVLIGPEMAVRDLDRNVSPEQRRCIYATFAENLGLTLAHWASPERLSIGTGDGHAITIPSRDRVRTVWVTDRSSAQSDFFRTGELVSHLGWALYQRGFCSPGRFHDARIEDEIGLEIPFRY